MRIELPCRFLLCSALSAATACNAPDAAIAAEGLPTEDEPEDEPEADDDGPAHAEAPVWGEPLPLVEAEAWRSESAEVDPLGHERPAQVACPSAAWGPELGGLEIQTGTCNYFFATQPSLAAIEAGDAIDVVVFHDRLDAAEPAEGHVAILLGDEVVWEQHVEIPAEANVLEARVIAEQRWPAGTTVGLHLHNHGYNAWTVLEVSMAPRT
jgi:hypothetical protein